MAMWMSNLPTMVWTFTLAMPTIILIHLQNSYLTPTWSWEATNAFFPCHFRWLWGDTLYKAMLEGKKVCMCSLHEPLGEPCKILAFNSSCAKGNKYQYVLWCGLCLWWNAFSNSSYIYIYIINHGPQAQQHWWIKLTWRGFLYHSTSHGIIHGFGQFVDNCAHD